MSVIVNSKGPDHALRQFNNLLTVMVVCLGLYLILAPLLPQLAFWVKDLSGQTNNITYSSNLNDNQGGKPIPSENRLVIPQMDLDNEVNEGRYADTLNKGVWHRPKTSTPDRGGNTVFVAHRFTYKSPATFYHLDKLKKDDVFAVFWNGKEYNYKVREIRTVNPSDVYIEDSTTDPILTLYTCTPMWTAKQRLVVISDLIPSTGDQT